MSETNTNISNTGSMKLRSLVDRIERLEEDKARISADLKEVYTEAKGDGFDVAILRKVVRLRARDAAVVQEEAALIALYMDAAQGDLFGDDSTKVTISAGGKSFETSTAQMREATRRPRTKRPVHA